MAPGGFSALEPTLLSTVFSIRSSSWEAAEPPDGLAGFPCVLGAHSPAAVQIAAALVMGADGVAIGTRLNCTPESTYPEHKKKALLEAGGPRAHQQKQLGLHMDVPISDQPGRVSPNP